jgi:hypothetical protein
MSYTVYKPTGANGTNPITVDDNIMNTVYYDANNTLGLQLPGRNCVNYGTAIAQNTIQMVSNFAGTALPSDTIALQGQLWFEVTGATTGNLLVRTSSSGAGGRSVNWQKIVTVASTQTGTTPVVNPATGTEKIGDLKVVGPDVSIFTSIGWKTLA